MIRLKLKKRIFVEILLKKIVSSSSITPLYELSYWKIEMIQFYLNAIIKNQWSRFSVRNLEIENADVERWFYDTNFINYNIIYVSVNICNDTYSEYESASKSIELTITSLLITSRRLFLS